MNAIQINTVDMDVWVWIAYLGCAILGGAASSFINNKGVWVRWRWEDNDTKERFILGPITDITAGIAAAMGVLWTMTPQTSFQLLGVGTVAGYGGSSILQALVNRLIADVSEKEREKIAKEKDAIAKEKEELAKWRKEIENDEAQLSNQKARLMIIDMIRKVK